MPERDRPCLTRAWRENRSELQGWLRHRLEVDAEADDLLQAVFLKALQQGERFCAQDNPRAWLFRVARHALIDRYRLSREQVPLPDDLRSPEDEPTPTVDALCQCLPRVLSELSAADRVAIELCDIQGQPQQRLAEHLGLSLSGAKSRLQRARLRLKARMESDCQVRYDEHGQVAAFTPCPPLDS